MPDRSKLVVIDLNRRCVRVLATEQDWVGRELSWSPDGSWLLATINANLVRVAADGSWRQSLGGSQQVEEAVLSPDGTLIAVTGRIRCCYKSQKPALIIVDADGTNARLVRGDHPEGMAVDPGTEQEQGYRGGVPSWSPDSRRLAYVHVAPEPIDYPEVSVRIMNLDGVDVASRSFPDRGPRDLETGRPTPATFGSPEWTPDGGLVATTFMEDPDQFLYWFTGTLRDAPGPTNPPFFVADDSIDLSPDGRRLLFEGIDPEALEDGHTPQVRVVNRADGKVRVLADRAMAPSWSPAGDRLAYATTRTERDRINIARTITVGDMAGNITPLWTVDDYGCECWLHAPPIWSPDGSRIAVTTKG